MLVTSQGTIITTFIKDLDGEAAWGMRTLSRSADCPKLTGVADPVEDCAAMQGNLNFKRNGLTGTSGNSTRGRANSCPWAGTTLMLGMAHLQSNLAEKDLEYPGRDQEEHEQ